MRGAQMPVLVMKFGGTSVATLDRIRRAAKRVGVEVAKGYDVIVIVSAMSGKTNELVGWVNETSPMYDAREYDAVVSSGENVTAGLMALTLQEMDVPARSWQGWQVPVKTTSAHSSARIEDIPPANISAKFAEAMFEEIASFGEASIRRIYGDFAGGSPQGWNKEKLAALAIVPHQQFANTTGKNASDIALVIDAMDILHSGRFDGFVLISSDSDFTRLASRIREEGLDVFGIGEHIHGRFIFCGTSFCS